MRVEPKETEIRRLFFDAICTLERIELYFPEPIPEPEFEYLHRRASLLLNHIGRLIEAPKLSSIRVAFTPTETAQEQGDDCMSTAVQGPVTLTTAGQLAQASVLGFDQFGNPFAGTIPPVTFSIDNPSVASSTPNSDGLTDEVAAVANGVANLTATLTTAEGVSLSDTETVTVAIAAAPPPPAPVLSSIKLAFAT